MPSRAITNDGSVIISDGKSQIRLSPDEAVSLSAGIRAAADSLIAGEADRHDVNILPNADEHRRSLGFTLADVAEAVYDPIRWMPDESSPSRLRCVGERGLEVVAAFTDETPVVLVVRPARSFDADSASWRRGGGGGSTKRTPKSLTPAQLAGRLADAGVDVDLSAGHYIVGRGKNQVTFASTPSDHRWLANTLARLRLLLDIDLREE